MMLTCAAAVRRALDDAMMDDPSVMVMGLGVNDPKRVFGTTGGLVEAHGEDRVIETPCSEAAMTGIAIGAALMGKRPVLVHQRVEFALLTMEQIINNAAKIDYITCGKHKCPIVIRLIIGRGWGQGPTHSQSLEVLFAHIPGLTVLVPHDANSHYHLMRKAIRLNGPVIFFEHRWLHRMKGKINTKKRFNPDAIPVVVRKGHDITLVSWGYGVHECLQAAVAMGAGGLSVGVVAVQSLNPLFTVTINEAAAETGHVLVVELGPKEYGISAEIAARIVDRENTMVSRMGASNFVPSTISLVEYAYPNVLHICNEAMSMIPNRALECPTDTIINTGLKMMARTPSDVPDNSFTGPF